MVFINVTYNTAILYQEQDNEQNYGLPTEDKSGIYLTENIIVK